MTVLGLILALVVVGVLLYLVNNFVPMDPRVRTILNVVVIIIVVLWLLSALLPAGGLLNARIGR